MKWRICLIKNPANNSWYDLFEDWDLIESSFTMQYGIRLSKENDMTWLEFKSLLSGIMPKTPLGQIVSIRSEEDKEVLKNFNKDQNKIRNEWRNKNNLINYMTDEEKAEKAKEAQELFKQLFSGI